MFIANVELVGTYLLISMPGFDITRESTNVVFTMNGISFRQMTIPPQSYNQQTRVDMQQTLAEVLRKFNTVGDDAVRMKWKDWMNQYCPKKTDVDAEAYITQIAGTDSAYKIPLDNIILRKQPRIKLRKISEEATTFTDSNAMKYYSENYYNASPSVVTRYTRHPPPPRLPSTNNSLLAYQLALKKEVNKEYYHTLSLGSREDIALELKRKFTYNSSIYAASGTKNEILEKIKSLDKDFESIFYSSIQEVDVENLHRLQNEPIFSDQDNVDIMLSIGTLKFSKLHLHDLRFETDITVNGMNMILELFRYRDDQIAASFEDFNKVSYQRNLFLGHEDSVNALSHPTENNTYLPQWYSGFDSLQRIYMVYSKQNMWTLIIIDIEKDSIWYINGCLDDKTQSTQEEMANIKEKILPFLKSHLQKEFNHRWKITSYPDSDVYNKVESTSDSGILVTCFIYFNLIRCPVKLIKADLQHARNFFGVSCMNGYLPY
jgi:hypothetical protein